MNHRLLIGILYALVSTVVIVGCQGTAKPTAQPTANSILDVTCLSILPTNLNDETQIQEIVKSEGVFTVAQDIDILMSLWSENGFITDTKHTPDIPDDDQKWQGLDAIHYRYVRVVFPSAPLLAEPAAMQITITGNNAEVISTTQIGDEISPDGDLWTFLKVQGCWKIQSLTFNREPLPS